jgi:hypothetical protein
MTSRRTFLARCLSGVFAVALAQRIALEPVKAAVLNPVRDPVSEWLVVTMFDDGTNGHGCSRTACLSESGVRHMIEFFTKGSREWSVGESYDDNGLKQIQALGNGGLLQFIRLVQYPS